MKVTKRFDANEFGKKKVGEKDRKIIVKEIKARG